MAKDHDLLKTIELARAALRPGKRFSLNYLRSAPLEHRIQTDHRDGEDLQPSLPAIARKAEVSNRTDEPDAI